MRIGVDAREIQNGVVTGIGRPLANFISFFSRAQSGHTLVLFSETPLPGNLVCGAETVVISKCPTFVWDQWKLPRSLHSRSIDLFYSPYYKVPLFTKTIIVGQILDLMYLVFPEYLQTLGPWKRLYYATFGKSFARKAESIVTDSEHAKADIVRLWQVDPGKITVIPLGLSPRYRPVRDTGTLEEARQRFKLPERFILYLGNFKPHKNVEFLIQLFARLSPRFPEYRLVLAGPLDAHGGKIQEVAAKSGVADRIIFTGAVREADCPEALYTLADLFVFPSLYEGFGLPPLEAMACGTPVAVSRETSLPEVVGEAGALFDPKNIDEAADIIARLLADNALLKRYAAAGLERAKLFCEEQTAGRVCSHLISMLPKNS